MPSTVTRPVGRVVEAGQQQRDRRLSRAARADECDGLPRHDMQLEAVEHVLALRVTELHVREVDIARDRRKLDGVVALDDLRIRIEQVEDSLAAGTGLLADRDEHGEHAGRRHELNHVRREREEGSERDVPLDGQPATEGQHCDLCEHWDRLQQRCVPRLQLDETNTRAVQVLAGVGEMAEFALLLAEALHDAHAGHGFVDDAGHLAGALLGVPTGGEDARPQPERHDHDRRDHEQRHDRQRWRQVRHHDDRQHEHDEVAEHDRQEHQQPLQQGDVTVGARHELTGLHLVVTGEVEPLQSLVDRVAQVVLHIEAHAAADEAADVRGAEADEAGENQNRQPRCERSRVCAPITSSMMTFSITGVTALTA